MLRPLWVLVLLTCPTISAVRDKHALDLPQSAHAQKHHHHLLGSQWDVNVNLGQFLGSDLTPLPPTPLRPKVPPWECFTSPWSVPSAQQGTHQGLRDQALGPDTQPLVLL